VGLTVLSYFSHRWGRNLDGQTTRRRCGANAMHPPPPETPGESGGEVHVELGAHPLVHVGRSLFRGCAPQCLDASRGCTRWWCDCPPHPDGS
jgi:hypothetical protein